MQNKKMECSILTFRDNLEYPILAETILFGENKNPYILKFEVKNDEDLYKQSQKFLKSKFGIETEYDSYSVIGSYVDIYGNEQIQLSIIIDSDFNLENDNYDWYDIDSCMFTHDINMVCAVLKNSLLTAQNITEDND